MKRKRRNAKRGRSIKRKIFNSATYLAAALVILSLNLLEGDAFAAAARNAEENKKIIEGFLASFKEAEDMSNQDTPPTSPEDTIEHRAIGSKVAEKEDAEIFGYLESAPETPLIENELKFLKESLEKKDNIEINNQTDREINVPQIMAAAEEPDISGAGAQILIVHTHASEAYTRTDRYSYEPHGEDRTLDKSMSVVRVGDEIARVLKENGIPVVHITEIFDSPTYSGSYQRSLDAIEDAIKENPSIKMVIDVHRDAVITKSGEKKSMSKDIDGKTAAQMMLVIGSDAGKLSHPNWKSNLGFALKIQERLERDHPGIMRPVNVRAARFNQHVTKASILLEVGTSGNTLEQALVSAEIFANALSDILLK